MKKKSWSYNATKKEPLFRRLMAHLSIYVRSEQYLLFEKYVSFNKGTKILDVGATPNEELVDSNFFEKKYPFPKNLTVASIEDCSKLNDIYPNIKIEKINPNSLLPYKNKQFDVVVSWATLEHVGGYEKQQDYINELLRVGEKVFITTPSRSALYEPHTGFLFLHWLPLNFFRKICLLTNKGFWGQEKNLNPLNISDLEKMNLKFKTKFKIFKLFHLLPSHIIIIST